MKTFAAKARRSDIPASPPKGKDAAILPFMPAKPGKGEPRGRLALTWEIDLNTGKLVQRGTRVTG
jgi:hypothetical protein